MICKIEGKERYCGLSTCESGACNRRELKDIFEKIISSFRNLVCSLGSDVRFICIATISSLWYYLFYTNVSNFSFMLPQIFFSSTVSILQISFSLGFQYH